MVLQDGCTDKTDSSTVVVGPNPRFELNSIDDDCEPLDAFWSPTSLTTDEYDYQVLDSRNNEIEPIAPAFGLLAGTYDYWIRATDQLGCSDSIRSVFAVRPLPNPSFTWTPEEADYDNKILTFTATDSATVYSWTIEDKAGNEREFTEELNEVGEYEAKLIVELEGCSASLTQWVNFKDAFLYHEVSSFTPNSDGLNDIYKPFVSGVKFLSYTICNRWGQLIYEGSLEDKGWDGTYQGSSAPQGDYLVLLNWQENSNRRVYTKSVLRLLK